MIALHSVFSLGRRVGRRVRNDSGNVCSSYQSLEQRLPLTTFVVNSLSDAVDASNEPGVVTLRDAIEASNSNAPVGNAAAGSMDGDRILFDRSLAGGVIELEQGELNVTDDVLIQGGNLEISIDAGYASRIFNVSTGDRVGFGKLNLVEGRADNGGAVLSSGTGTVLLLDSTLAENIATQSGGAIFIANGKLFATNNDFSQNSTLGSGGAFFSSSGLSVFRGGTFHSNSAEVDGGAVAIDGGNLLLIDSEVGADGRANTAGNSLSSGRGDGGGIHVSGTGRVAVDGGAIGFNVARLDGGGIWTGDSGFVSIRNAAVVSDNLASAFDAGSHGGGGIYNDGATVFLRDSSVARNRALGDGATGGGVLSQGGILRVVDSTFAGNFAADSGGGIGLVTGNAVLKGATITENMAGMPTNVGFAAPGNGGGVYVAGADSDMAIRNSEIADNVAAGSGGGVWGGPMTSIHVRAGSVVAGNEALTALPALNSDLNDAPTGGGIYSSGFVDIRGSSVLRNSTPGSGGGIGFDESSSGRIVNVIVEDNTAGRSGGGLYSSGFVRARDSNFTGNIADLDGGGLFSSFRGRIRQIDLIFSGNSPNDSAKGRDMSPVVN